MAHFAWRVLSFRTEISSFCVAGFVVSSFSLALFRLFAWCRFAAKRQKDEMAQSSHHILLKVIFEKIPNTHRYLKQMHIHRERRRGRVVRAAWLWCRKSPYRVSSRLGCAMRRPENSLCQPSRKWVPFSN